MQFSLYSSKVNRFICGGSGCLEKLFPNCHVIFFSLYYDISICCIELQLVCLLPGSDIWNMSEVKNNVDFIQLLEPDMSIKILNHLDDPCDLVRVSIVSSSWHRFGKAFEFN